MAEIIDMTLTTPPVADGNTKVAADGRTSNAGRKFKFTPQEDLIITQEVAPAEAHLAPNSETHTLFEKFTEREMENPNFATQVTGKSFQDRFKKLLDDFASRDAKDCNLSGDGGDIRELDDQLSHMLETRRDRDAKKDGDAKERAEQEEKKIAAGNAMVLNALRGKDRKKKDSSDEESASKKRRVDGGDSMTQIGLALRESEATRVELERERLQFDCERWRKRTRRKPRSVPNAQKKENSGRKKFLLTEVEWNVL